MQVEARRRKVGDEQSRTSGPIERIEESWIDARIRSEKQGRERGETNAQTGYDPASRDVHVRGKQARETETHQYGYLPDVRIDVSEFGKKLTHDRKCHAYASNTPPVLRPLKHHLRRPGSRSHRAKDLP